MVEPINLRRVRKAADRQAKESQAAEARARHGRDKAAKAADKDVAKRAKKTLDQAKRERP